MKRNRFILAMAAALLAFTGCTVFEGGVSGTVVDKDSGNGIADVEVYGYVEKKDRDNDFAEWESDTVFAPAAEYYGHTTTASDGTFTISKMMWQAAAPNFGKDGDYCTLYMIYYNENYGAVKGDTIIVSDTVSNCVHQELEEIYHSTVLNINLKDVSNDSNTSNAVYVKATYPTVSGGTDSEDATITGSGTITIRNRLKDSSGNDVSSNEVTLVYYQSAEEVEWMPCLNGGTSGSDYSFFDSTASNVKKSVPVTYDSYSVNLYGKACKLSMPVFSGQYNKAGDKTDDGKLITFEASDSNSNTIDCTGYSASTSAETIGTTNTQSHGNFSGLGDGLTWTDTSYTGKYVTLSVTFYINGTTDSSGGREVYSYETSRTVQLTTN